MTITLRPTSFSKKFGVMIPCAQTQQLTPNVKFFSNKSEFHWRTKFLVKIGIGDHLVLDAFTGSAACLASILPRVGF